MATTASQCSTKSGTSPGDQPNPSGLVELLWSLYPVSFATDMALRQRHIGCVGHAKVQALLEQAQAPTGETLRSRREGERDQFCFCCAVENPRPRGIGIVFAPQHRLEPLFDQLAPGPLDSGDAGVHSAAAIRLSLQP